MAKKRSLSEEVALLDRERSLKMAEKLCKVCGKEFKQSEFDLMFPDKNPLNLFCSDDCYESSLKKGGVLNVR